MAAARLRRLVRPFVLRRDELRAVLHHGDRFDRGAQVLARTLCDRKEGVAGFRDALARIAGLAALFKQLHPDWSPMMIKSALMTTAKTAGVTKEDGVTPADAFDYGSGRIDLARVGNPGITFDATGQDYLDHQGDLWNTNYPSIYIPDMPGRITVQRTAHSVVDRNSRWSLTVSGPGDVTFADASAAVTTATFSRPGEYVLSITADNGTTKATSSLIVKVELPPPAAPLAAVFTTSYGITSPLWASRAKALIVSWIPHCIDVINRGDVTLGPGGIDNFIEAGKKLRGEKAGYHKGYVFSNAWVHQTVEAMSIALMIDPQGDPEIMRAHEKFRATLENWVPIILAAQEPDGYLQTAFTLDRIGSRVRSSRDEVEARVEQLAERARRRDRRVVLRSGPGEPAD